MISVSGRLVLRTTNVEALLRLVASDRPFEVPEQGLGAPLSRRIQIAWRAQSLDGLIGRGSPSSSCLSFIIDGGLEGCLARPRMRASRNAVGAIQAPVEQIQTLERGYAAARAQIITVLGLPKVRIIECLRLVVRTVAQQKDRNPPRMRDVASILLRGNHDRSPWANASGATAEANRSPFTLAEYSHRYIRHFALL